MWAVIIVGLASGLGSWMFPGYAQEAKVSAHLAVSSGVIPDERGGPAVTFQNYANPLESLADRFWPARSTIGYAWRTFTARLAARARHGLTDADKVQRTPTTLAPT